MHYTCYCRQPLSSERLGHQQPLSQLLTSVKRSVASISCVESAAVLYDNNTTQPVHIRICWWFKTDAPVGAVQESASKEKQKGCRTAQAANWAGRGRPNQPACSGTVTPAVEQESYGHTSGVALPTSPQRRTIAGPAGLPVRPSPAKCCYLDPHQIHETLVVKSAGSIDGWVQLKLWHTHRMYAK